MTCGKWTVVFAVVLWIGASIGCSTSGPVADTMPAGESYSGLWYSPQYEHMYLHQSGDEVVGVYTHRNGGELEGTVEGNMLLFSWEQPGDRDEVRRGMSGQGYFHLVIRDGETHLQGEWGYNEERQGAPWEAEFVRELKDHDPKNLQDLRERR